MSGCEGYDAIARVYDKLNAELDYEAWADFFERCFEKYLEKRPELVLDLACGTGRMTRTLAARGYDMIGVDGSYSMLNEAYMQGAEGILYLLQDMRSFELYGTVGAVVCCLDSINYLLDEKDVRKVFSLVHNYLDPDGLFIFDVNTPYKFENTYGNEAYILEDEDDGGAVFCGWQNEYDRESGICEFYLSLFEENGDGTYSRSDEHQRERCYDYETICRLLSDCGFEVIGRYAGYGFETPDENTERWYIAAKAKK
ncbi:MAG: class I SAM-dependent methyltransferase [Clostridia bacterium]|nr:class I SAM-dependent methyltransferase [Clostridia bacterium]